MQQVLLELKGLKEPLEHKVLKDPPVQLVNKVHKVYQDLKDLKGHKDPTDHQ